MDAAGGPGASGVAILLAAQRRGWPRSAANSVLSKGWATRVTVHRPGTGAFFSPSRAEKCVSPLTAELPVARARRDGRSTGSLPRSPGAESQILLAEAHDPPIAGFPGQLLCLAEFGRAKRNRGATVASLVPSSGLPAHSLEAPLPCLEEHTMPLAWELPLPPAKRSFASAGSQGGPWEPGEEVSGTIVCIIIPPRNGS
jgi:hypothetical protein